MEKFKSLISNINLPTKNEIKQAFDSFGSKKRVVFVLLLAVFAVSALIMLNKVNNLFLTETPMAGGEISEGIVGTPRFINPVLALSDSDKDLTALIYSGLMRKNPDGELVPDLASKYDISQNGLVYTFTLRDNIFFHDKKEITSDDIIFTINKIKDPAIKSPKKLNWEGVTATKVDDRIIQFTLKQPYASFLENTTVGILPAHLWKNITAEQFAFIELNTNGVGSGPYKIKKISKKSSGVPDYYILETFNKFALGKPLLKNLTIHFYENEKALISALENGDVSQVSAISPEKAAELQGKGYPIQTAVLPRVFGLFFNKNQSPVFNDKKVIEAFEQAINKDEIISQVLYGYGAPIDSPIPKNMLDYNNLENIGGDGNGKKIESYSIESAKKILEDDGWKLGSDGVMEKKAPKGKEKLKLEFSISTGDAPELKDTAEIIKKDLEAIGAKVEVKIFEIGSLNQDVIRPRKYEALFFGQIVGNQGDLFAFWHSSQRNDPGLNIAMHTNAKVDKILEATLDTMDKKELIKKYAQFEDEIKKDKPAIFIYSPEFIYVTAKNINGLIINKITNPSDRFTEAEKWYLEKDKVWKIFNKK